MSVILEVDALLHAEKRKVYRIPRDTALLIVMKPKTYDDFIRELADIQPYGLTSISEVKKYRGAAFAITYDDDMPPVSIYRREITQAAP